MRKITYFNVVHVRIRTDLVDDDQIIKGIRVFPEVVI